MKKKMFALLLVSVWLTVLLSGCGSKNQVVDFEDTKDQIIRITFFGDKYETENVEVIEEIISGFMEENPQIRVSYESMKGEDYYDALKKRMAAGKGNDVFMVNHDTLLEFKKNGQAADLSGLDSIKDYTKDMYSQMEEEGKIYWVPTTVSAFGLYCNKDLLEKHHMKVPETLPEWMEVCGYFLSQGITPVIANSDISLKTLAIGRGFYSVYQESRQEEVFDRLNSGEERLSDYLTDGFAIVKELIDKGYVDADKALETKKTSDDLEEFVKGESPFLLTGAWAAGRVENMKPGFHFEVAPLPVLEDGSLLVINADTRLSVNAHSAHPEAAMKFVEYFTREDNIYRFASQQSSFCPLAGKAVSAIKAIRPLVAVYEAGRTVIGTDARLELPIWTITAQASRMLLSGETLENTMDWIDRQAEQERNGA